MKGFVRILEAIIASIILLTSMTFFLTPSVMETGWGDALTKIQGQDTLYTMYKNLSLVKNIKYNDVSAINNNFTDFFSKVIDFSIEINGIPNSQIYIGCNCTDAEVSDLKTMLSPLDFNYNDRGISIRISNESISSIKNETDILFIFGYKNLSDYRSVLNKFLENSGTIFILGDLTKTQVEDDYINVTFGLRWNDIENPVGNTEFYDIENPGNVSYKISKYFVNVSGSPKTTLFQKFNWVSGKNQVVIDNNTIIKDQGNKFSFVKIKKGVINGNGRTVWFAGFTPNNDYNTTKLLKSAIMWASGESYNMNPYIKTYPKRYAKTKFIVFDNDTYEVVLTLWKVFY